MNDLEKTGTPNLGKLTVLKFSKIYHKIFKTLRWEKNFKTRKQLQGHSAIVNAVRAQGENTLYSGGGDCKLIAWNLDTLEKIADIAQDGYINCIAVNPEGVVYSAGQNKSITAVKLK